MKQDSKPAQIRVIVGGKPLVIPKSAVTPVQSSATCVCRDCQFK